MPYKSITIDSGWYNMPPVLTELDPDGPEAIVVGQYCAQAYHCGNADFAVDRSLFKRSDLMAYPEMDTNVRGTYSATVTIGERVYTSRNVYLWPHYEETELSLDEVWEQNKYTVALYCKCDTDDSYIYVIFGALTCQESDLSLADVINYNNTGIELLLSDICSNEVEPYIQSSTYIKQGISLTLNQLLEPVTVPTTPESPVEKLGSATFGVSSTTTGAEFHYTLDGTDPTSESPLYSEKVTIKKNSTVKVVGIKNKLLNSDIASLIINVKLPTPEASSSVDGDEATISLTNSEIYSDYENVEFKVQINEEEVTTETFPLTVVRNGIYKIQATGSNNVASDQYQFSITDITVDTPIFDNEGETSAAKVGTAKVGTATVG